MCMQGADMCCTWNAKPRPERRDLHSQPLSERGPLALHRGEHAHLGEASLKRESYLGRPFEACEVLHTTPFFTLVTSPVHRDGILYTPSPDDSLSCHQIDVLSGAIHSLPAISLYLMRSDSKAGNWVLQLGSIRWLARAPLKHESAQPGRPC